MFGKLYIKGKSDEYVKTVVPFEAVASISDALGTKLMLSPLDVEGVGEFANDVIVKLINTTDSLDWIIEVWNEDTSEQWGTLVLDDDGVAVFTADDSSEELRRCVHRLAVEISDYVSSAALTLASRKSSGTALTEDPTATSASTCKGAEDEDDSSRLIDEIRKHTKADIVKPKETLADYICDSTLMEELEEIKNFFENEALYKSLGIKLPKGILFKGVPGTGKTYAARCIAGSVDCWFMSCTASALQGMYVGSGAENIRMVFKGAKTLREKTKKGVIVFIDEIDSFGNRDSHSGNAGGEEDRTLNQLLAEMSGFEDEEGIMVLAATNYPERLDDALMRSGRFSRQITIERPDECGRRCLVEYYFNKIKMTLKDTDFDEISCLTAGFTPADIQEVANETAILAVRRDKSDMGLDEVNESINKVLTKNIRRPDKAGMAETVAIHEIGHVVAEAMYLDTISLKVTNFSYGSAGGFTQPAEVMEGLVSKSRLKGYVMSLLGGRVAERIYGEITTGASEDLDRAKRTIKSYFNKYHFESYEVDKLEQLVEDTLTAWTEELYIEFCIDEVRGIISKLIDELKVKRVLYRSDIATIISPIISF